MNGDYKVVGVNAYADPDEKPATNILKVNPEVQRRQIERVREVRQRRRDQKAAAAALAELRRASQTEREPDALHHRVRQELLHRGGDLRVPGAELWGEYREESVY